MTLVQPIVILTRPETASKDFAVRLRQELGFVGDIIVSPLLKIEASREIPGLDGILESTKGLVFTSKNGVAAFVHRSARRDLPCWCVGGATREAAKQAGLMAFDAAGDAEALIRRILADAPHGPLLHLRGQKAQGDVAQTLSAAGIETNEVILYHQVAQTLSERAKEALRRENPVILPLFSPNTARHFASQRPFVAPLNVVAISDNAAKEVVQLTMENLVIAQNPDASSMLQAINALIAAD